MLENFKFRWYGAYCDKSNILGTQLQFVFKLERRCN